MLLSANTGTRLLDRCGMTKILKEPQMKSISFTIYAPVQGKARPRFTKTGHVYMDPKTKEYERLVRDTYLASGGQKFDGAVRMEMTCRYMVPKSASNTKKANMLARKIVPQTKPDADNIAKIIMDALNGAAYEDDKNVTSLHIEKIYGMESSVTVTISEQMRAKRKG